MTRGKSSSESVTAGGVTPGAGLTIAGQVAAAALTGRFAHDLNNHLTTILGKAELALLSDDPERMAKALEVGAEAARKSRELVAQMQRFAASQRGSELTTFDPLDAARPVLVLLARALDKHGVTLERRFGQTGTMTGDLGALSLAIYHLVLNAAEALEAGGGHIQLTLEQKGQELELRVADDGPGLPPEVLERAARPGFASSDPADGGLALAARAAEAHGGRLVASARPGGGGLVSIRIPIQPSAA